jgi:hypothetical protein
MDLIRYIEAYCKIFAFVSPIRWVDIDVWIVDRRPWYVMLTTQWNNAKSMWWMMTWASIIAKDLWNAWCVRHNCSWVESGDVFVDQPLTVKIGQKK